jgi:hypothetical protein
MVQKWALRLTHAGSLKARIEAAWVQPHLRWSTFARISRILGKFFEKKSILFVQLPASDY